MKLKEITCPEGQGWGLLTGERMEKHPTKGEGHCGRAGLFIRANFPPFFWVLPPKAVGHRVGRTGPRPREAVRVRWCLLTVATYIISVLARGARRTTGTHGTLEDTGGEGVRMTRIRKKEGKGGKEDSRWEWRIHVFVHRVQVGEGALTEAPGSPGSPGGPWKPWGPWRTRREGWG